MRARADHNTTAIIIRNNNNVHPYGGAFTTLAPLPLQHNRPFRTTVKFTSGRKTHTHNLITDDAPAAHGPPVHCSQTTRRSFRVITWRFTRCRRRAVFMTTTMDNKRTGRYRTGHRRNPGGSWGGGLALPQYLLQPSKIFTSKQKSSYCDL